MTDMTVPSISDPARYAGRRRRNAVATFFAWAAAAFGVGWLVLILGVLLYEGIGGLSLAVFTENTPPPGSAGGLLNAIVGSLIMAAVGTMIGTPVGIMAGIYLAEYGNSGWLAPSTRFVSDILLSAPSIVIGLFIYAALITEGTTYRTVGYSAIAGALAPR